MRRRLPRRMPLKSLPKGVASPFSGFVEGVALALAVISESAIRKAEQAGPDGTAKFVVRLEHVLMPPSEIGALTDLGMTEYLPFFKQAMVALPGRFLLDVAELPSVLQVV